MMARVFLTVKTGKTLYIDLAEALPGRFQNGEGQVSLTLREKKGRSARFEVVADEKVFIDLHPRNSVKLAADT
jgi:hypothetical protein